MQWPKEKGQKVQTMVVKISHINTQKTKL